MQYFKIAKTDSNCYKSSKKLIMNVFSGMSPNSFNSGLLLEAQNWSNLY